MAKVLELESPKERQTLERTNERQKKNERKKKEKKIKIAFMRTCCHGVSSSYCRFVPAGMGFEMRPN